ncbi:Dabb family protein [Rhodococcus sp. MS16]|uniref:Dabb family protein n=1 Tax=Rhodococcus sp. MS16 TaxID=2579941 RepID=UPI0015620429|nr:Dabb family protein [Rhodococcus sp. MS16]NRI69205.1 Dabb family protein [Rhodococcus sp. MS16]
MYNVTRIVHAAENATTETWDAAVASVTAAAEASGATRQIVSRTLPGVINGGDLIVHLQFSDEHSWEMTSGALDGSFEHPAIERFHGVEYQSGTSGRSAIDTRNSVYRTLLLRVAPGTEPSSIEHFESDLLRMPALVSSIGAWRLSRVTTAVGPTPWTHVWEQEFTDHASLLGQYLDHPIHWGVVDRWFDPECTEVIVRDRVCHSFCALGTPILLGT